MMLLVVFLYNPDVPVFPVLCFAAVIVFFARVFFMRTIRFFLRAFFLAAA